MKPNRIKFILGSLSIIILLISTPAAAQPAQPIIADQLAFTQAGKSAGASPAGGNMVGVEDIPILLERAGIPRENLQPSNSASHPASLPEEGTYQWHTFYGSDGFDACGFMGIALDSHGGIYIAGRSEGAWDGPAGQPPLHAYSGYADLSILKLDSMGAYEWHTFYESTDGSEFKGYKMIMDSHDHLTIASHTARAWNGPEGQAPRHAYSGGWDIAVLSLDVDGSYLWHTFYGAAGEDFSIAIGMDEVGDLYFAGWSDGAWNGPAGQAPLHAHGGYFDITVLKLNAAGDYLWHTFFGSPDWDDGYGIAVDGSGGVYITGFSGSSWDGPAGQAPLHAHGGYVDIVVVKLGSAGEYQWHTFYGSPEYNEGYAIAVDGSGGVYITGFDEGSWNGPAGQAPLHAYSGGWDIGVLKLDAAGAYQWHTFYGSADWDLSNAIALDKGGGLYITGDSLGGWYGPAGQAPLHAHSGNENIFVLKLDTAGAYQWHTFYGESGGVGGGITPGASGELYIAASSGYTWNGPEGQPPLNAHKNDWDLTVLKLQHGCSLATASQPLLLVTGWGGSEDQELATDEQLGYFEAWLAPHGYVAGCNLFYAAHTSPHLSLEENAQVIQDNLCQAYQSVRTFRPRWNGHFDIIAHSYGGLRARAYLENDNLYGRLCPDTANRVYVDNLFTLGTPHGGEIGDLPLSTFIGLGAMGGGEGPAIQEMLPAVRLWQNLSSQQPAGTNYYLLAGDARLQYSSYPPTLQALYDLWPFPTERLEANDLAVHQASAWVLPRYAWLYPEVSIISTPDLHGQLPEDIFGAHQLRSYVNPNTTFEAEIWPAVGQTSRLSLTKGAAEARTNPAETAALIDMLQQQASPQAYPGGGWLDIQSGVISSRQVITGHFDLYGSEPSQISLVWMEGDLALELSDPLGNRITPQAVITGTNINFINFDTGYGWLASYQITDTLTGTWGYTITAPVLPQAVNFRLFAIESLPVAVNASIPAWLPNHSTVVITASVTYSSTQPVSGGSLLARIQLPDASYAEMALWDDGAHGDGLPNDGIFGEAFTQTAQGGLYGVQLTATGTYASQEFRRTNTAIFFIAPGTVELDGLYDDFGINQTHDEYYEWLGVSAGITVTQPGTYTLSAELYAGEAFISQVSMQIYLEPGNDSITLLFDGDDIRAHQLDGPYTVRNVMLFDTAEVMLLIEADDYVRTTAAYSYLEFKRTGQIFFPFICTSVLLR
jgi:hypothetical protein